jgi:methionine-S-sulfoxide reductase
MKQIYLAGGCFWGTEKYLSLIPGVIKTDVGYANGRTANPSYEEVCHNDTGHAETVRVEYNPDTLGLPFLLDLFYDAIDPTSMNHQGHDAGTQYRTGIYYVDEEDRQIILDSIAILQGKYKKPIAVEVLPLENYYTAEEYHQKYLEKKPGGYCHIGKDTLDRLRKRLGQTG